MDALKVKKPADRALALAREIAQVKGILDQAVRPLYERLDYLTEELVALVGVNAEVPAEGEIVGVFDRTLVTVPDQMVKVIDQFATKNVAFKTAAIRRFE